MDRFASAFERLSSARRILFSAREQGEEEALRAAREEVRRGLDVLGDASFRSPEARASLAVLRAAVHGDALSRLEFSAAVDDLASRLYWSESTLAF